MCRALKILCAAASPERLGELRRAAVSAHWELVGGAFSVNELVEQVELYAPDVIVVDGSLGPVAVDAVRGSHLSARVVSVGSLPGADATARSLEEVRDAIMGVPTPGGPVSG
jgi:chemotaxis response regulator CheB